MRFGVSGDLFPHHVDEFTPAMAQRAVEMGFTGIFTRFDRDDPFATAPAQCHRVRDIVRDYGLVMVQAIGHRPPLIHPDESIRREAVRTLRAAVDVAAELGSLSCHTGPGSLAQTGASHADWGGAWAPHPQNWSEVCRRQLVTSLREAAPHAEDRGIVIGLEGHVLVVLRSAEVMRDVLDEVGSPAVTCDFDPVNWLRLETVFESGTAIAQMMDQLGGERIFNAHAKDVIVEPRLVTHLDEVPAGRGILDYDVFLRRMEEIGGERFVIVEHASLEEITVTRAFLGRKAAELGIRVG